jgi:hypothetical protein
LSLEQAKGYVKAQGKSTYPRSTMKEVFEHGTRDDSAGGDRLNIVLRVLSAGERVLEN